VCVHSVSVRTEITSFTLIKQPGVHDILHLSCNALQFYISELSIMENDMWLNAGEDILVKCSYICDFTKYG
jgi:hypothetical protein